MEKLSSKNWTHEMQQNDNFILDLVSIFLGSVPKFRENKNIIIN